MSTWPDEWAMMKLERNEWRDVARRSARLTLALRRVDLLLDGDIAVEGDEVDEAFRELKAASAAISDADLAKAVAPDDGDGAAPTDSPR